MKTARIILGLAWGAAGLAGAGHAAEKQTPAEATVQAWKDSARYFSNEAHREFTRLLKRGADTREIRLGLALTLLSVQPVVPENLVRARAELAELAKSDDECGLAARFFQARIAQSFQEEPDFGAAAEGYRRLVREHGETYWGQLALGKLAVLTLYALPNQNGAARIAAAEALLPAAKEAAARDLHLMIADAVLYYGLPPEGALAHLLAAAELSERVSLPDAMRADLYIQIGELSARGRNLPQARAYLAKMEELFPRDWRNWALRQIIDAIAAGKKPAIP